MKQRMWSFIGLVALVVIVGGMFSLGAPPASADSFPVELQGTVERLPTGGLMGTWQVAGVPVQVDALTRISQRMGPVGLGSWVKVHGVPDGTGGILAQRIKTEEMKPYAELEGTLDAADATGWTIAGIRLTRDANTLVIGTLQVGLRVKALYTPMADGTLLAIQVKAEDSSLPPPPPPGTPPAGTYVKFHGTIESIPDGRIGTWVISGWNVEVTPTTWIDEHKGLAVVGAPVEVEGIQQADGSILASKIEVERHGVGGPGGGIGAYTKFYGTVESMPASGYVGTWVVSGQTVEVTPATYIEMEHGVPTVGSYVEVKGYLQADGSILADKMEVKSGGQGGGTQPGQWTEFYGQVESMPAGLIGDWTISGRVVHTSIQTRFEQEHGPFQVGAWVEVKGYVQMDGSINAVKMETKSYGSGGGGTPGQYTKFYGQVESFPPGLIGDWTISGRLVHATAQTRFKQEHGPFQVGAWVEVEGYVQADGSVNAIKIETKSSGPGGGGTPGQYIEFYGQVESFPPGLIGDWVISGRVVHATAQTRFEQEHGPFQVGAWVEVKGYVQADGSVNATKIETKSYHDVGDDRYVPRPRGGQLGLGQPGAVQTRTGRVPAPVWGEGD